MHEHQPTRRNNESTEAGHHRRMRRADREVIDPVQIRAIIASGSIMHVSYMDAEGLTVVPLNFGFIWKLDSDTSHGDGIAEPMDTNAKPSMPTLYFHSAPVGRKIDAIKAANDALIVAFAMETDCEIVEGRTLCNWGEAYKSVVGTGTASIVHDLDEARIGLQALMSQQAHISHATFTDQQACSTAVWKITVDHITAKMRPKPQNMATHHQSK